MNIMEQRSTNKVYEFHKRYRKRFSYSKTDRESEVFDLLSRTLELIKDNLSLKGKLKYITMIVFQRYSNHYFYKGFN